MMKSKFQNSDVEALYTTLKKFRNEFEDEIHSIIIKTEYYECGDGSIRADMQFLEKSAYLVFEYFLIMLEKFSICDMAMFRESQLYTLLTNTVNKYQ